MVKMGLMGKSRVARFVALALVLSQSGFVQAAQESAFSFFEEEAKVVAASQHPQKISQAPASAYVVTAQDIERYGYRTLAEALQSIPGIYATSDRNYTYLWFRGFGRPSDYNNRVLVLIDGHRLNDHTYGGAYVGYELPVDMKAVHHVEVIKGPASALYGDSAFFGVVNVVTKKAGDAPLVEAAVETGSYGEHKEFVAVAPEFKNGLKAYFSGSYRHMNGQSLFYPEFTSTNNGVATRDNDAESNGTFFTQMSYAGFTLTENSSRRTKHIPTGAFSTTFNDPQTRTADAWSYVEVKGEHRPVPNFLLTSRVYYDWYDYNGTYIYDNASPPPPTTKNVDLLAARSYGQEIRVRMVSWGEENALTLGEEYEKTARSHQKNYTEGAPPPLDIDINTTPYHWAAYLQQEWQPYSALALTMGLRRDYYQTFGQTVNPRFAAIHQLWTDSQIKLLYGTAFRAPSAYEMFYGSGATFLTNPDLAPEKITSTEMVWEQQFSGRGVVRMSGYQNKVTNLIDQTVLPDTRLQFQNRGSIKSTGMELYSQWAWSRAISSFAGYNLQETRDNNDKVLTNSPTHSGSAGVSAWIEPTRTTISVQGFFISTRRTLQNTGLPPATLFSLTVREQPWKAGPTLFASVYNAFNSNYAVSGAGEHVQDRIRQDGRSYTAGLEYQFR